MASSASGQDESNPAMWLATRAGKIEPSCPLGTTRLVPQEKFPQKPYNKKALGQYPAILTSHLVNNPYLLIVCTLVKAATACSHIPTVENITAISCKTDNAH